MDDKDIYFVGLLGLRALAEFDPFEYLRCTDLTKGELEMRIKLGVESQAHESVYPSYQQLKSILDYSRTQVEMGMLLRQFYSLCLLSVQQETAGRRDRSGDILDYDVRELPPHIRRADNFDEALKEVELARLSVIRLLRYLPEYRPIFDLRIKQSVVDCLLSPRLSGLPSIVIEVKGRARNEEKLLEHIDQIKTLRDLIEPEGVGVLILGTNRLPVQTPKSSTDIYVLSYNVNKDELTGADLNRLLERIDAI